jgi:hypothetical protein
LDQPAAEAGRKEGEHRRDAKFTEDYYALGILASEIAANKRRQVWLWIL